MVYHRNTPAVRFLLSGLDASKIAEYEIKINLCVLRNLIYVVFH